MRKMNHYVLPIVTLLCMVDVGSHAATTPEFYWKNMLPNTPMPLTIRNSLPHPASAIQTELDNVDPARALFFLEKDLNVGSQMTFEFTKSTKRATFLAREKANVIPFSSDKVPEILREFSLKPDSIQAPIVKKTIKICETKANPGEVKYCATSLEAMVDFAASTIGNNIKVISTIVNDNNKVENYTITGVKKAAKEEKNIICHKLNYAYVVFYCHKAMATSSYEVSLVGSNGSSSKAAAICHKDTSGWNPKHLAFQLLNIKPGTVPICHFLSEEHIIWAPNN